MTEFTDQFANVAGWNLYNAGSLVAIGNKAYYGTGTPAAGRVFEPSTGNFRLAGSIVVPNVTGTENFYSLIGLSSNAALSETAAWTTIGIDGKGFCSLYVGTTQNKLRTEALTAGTYLVTIVGDEHGVSFAVMKSDGSIELRAHKTRAEVGTIHQAVIYNADERKSPNGNAIGPIGARTDLETLATRENIEGIGTSRAYSTTDAAGKKIRGEFPAAFDSRVAPKGHVLCFHGAGDKELENWPIDIPARRAMFKALLAAGYCIWSTTTSGEFTYGNEQSAKDGKELYDYVHANYIGAPIVVLGFSGGGAAAYLTVKKNEVPVAALVEISGLANVGYVKAHRTEEPAKGFVDTFCAAYGLVSKTGVNENSMTNYGEKITTPELDPNLWEASVFRGIPVVLLASPEDTLVLKTENADKIKAKLEGHEVFLKELTTGGAHASEGNFPSSSTVTLINEALEASPAPTIVKPADQSSVRGAAVGLLLEVAHATEVKVTGLPTGLVYNAVSGEITGNGSAAEVDTITVTAKGPGGETTTTFKWTITEPVHVVVAGAQKPPLELQTELVFPDGTTTRWDRDAKLMKDRPTGISTRSQRYTGWTDSQLALARRIDIDYPDLGLLDGINMIGHDGSVAYEGAAATLPRSLEGSHQVGVQAQGWMSAAKDETFVEIYIERLLSNWSSAPASWVAAVLAEDFSYGTASSQPVLDEAGQMAMELALSGKWTSPWKPLVDTWWTQKAGIALGAIYYNFLGNTSSATMNSADANWNVRAALMSDDKGTARDFTTNLWPGPSSGYLEATGERLQAMLQLWYNATPAGTDGASYSVQLANPALYGAHGLTRRGPDPGGFTVSDMVIDFLSRFAPLLDTSGIQATDFVVPQAAFLDDISPFDAWQKLNAYHRWEMAVYEERKALYWPIDLNDYDWEVRLSDFGTSTSLQGDDASVLCNGVTVRYTDLDTGYETRLSPATYSELRDDSPNNPYNIHGRPNYQPLSLSAPTTKEGAIQIARAYLAEFNRPKAPGTITVNGHIRDRAGHWQQGWKVKSSDRVIIADMPNDGVRVVGETDWDHDAKNLRIAVDSNFKQLDAILARQDAAIEASGISLP